MLADRLSRAISTEDWQVAPPLFNRLQAQYGKVTVDRFASHGNQLCPRFNSEFLCPGTDAVDAFSQNWRRHPIRNDIEFNWWNPPWSLIPRVIDKIRIERASGLLVVPAWPSAIWWPTLRQLATELTIIPPSDHIFLPRGSSKGVGAPNWNVAIAYIQPSSSEKQNY